MTLGHGRLHQARYIKGLLVLAVLSFTYALEIGLCLCLLPLSTAIVLSIDATGVYVGAVMVQSSGKVALITGATGQDDAYLAELLLSKRYVVHAVKRRSSSFNTERVYFFMHDPHEQGGPSICTTAT